MAKLEAHIQVNITEEQFREYAQKYVAEIRAEVKADIAQECHYLLASGMGKKKSLEHLIGILEEKGEQK